MNVIPFSPDDLLYTKINETVCTDPNIPKTELENAQCRHVELSKWYTENLGRADSTLQNLHDMTEQESREYVHTKNAGVGIIGLALLLYWIR